MKRFIDISQFILVLFGLMICGLFVTSLLGMIPIGGLEQKWLVFAGQNVLAFILPALLAWRICFKQSPITTIEANIMPSGKMLAIAVAIYMVGIPALNQIVYWNQEMHFPEAFTAFERWCREMEKLAEEQMADLLNTTALGATIMNILIIGCLTGIGEEFFFRGALQRMLVYCKLNHHVAILIAAVIFSVLHFQFFGFLPRLLLGVWFGYLYSWSRCIWISAFAHALNNSLVIISVWCINKGLFTENFDMVGVMTQSFPIWALISACAVGALLFLLRSKLHLSNQNKE